MMTEMVPALVLAWATVEGVWPELMSQHEQLDVFGDLAAPASDKQPQHSREGEIGEGKQHPLMLPEPKIGRAHV